MKIIDTSNNTSGKVNYLKSLGVSAVGRYFSLRNSKRITIKEAQEISSAGMKVFVVFENDGDPLLTFDEGVHHAQIAQGQAEAIGQPQGSAIYFALEHLPGGYRSSDVRGVMTYMQGVASVLDGQYKVGAYSNGVVLDALLKAGLCHYAWVSASKSFEGTTAFVASEQWALNQLTPIDQDWEGLSIDVNDVKGDFGAFQVPLMLASTVLADQNIDTAVMPWMEWMEKNIGEVQLTGAIPTDFTKLIFSHTSYGSVGRYTPPSCAATICAALEISGYKSTHSAAAKSYILYGIPCELRPGCIVVYQWDNGEYHVDFCSKIEDNGQTIQGLGGNQGHRLAYSKYSASYVKATRWPIKMADGELLAMADRAATPAAINLAVDAGAVFLPGDDAGSFTVRTGHRYRATIHLNGLETLAPNDIVAAKVAGYGFTNVTVSGSGGTRIAEATWPGPDTTGTLDSHLSDVTEIG